MHVLNSQLELLKVNPTEVNLDKELRRVGTCYKILIRNEPLQNTNYITLIKDKTRFQIR